MRFLKYITNSMRSRLATMVAAVCLFLLGASASAVDVVIPDTGVDTSGFITSAITAVGLVVATAVGGYFAFLVIRKGIRWASKALG